MRLLAGPSVQTIRAMLDVSTRDDAIVWVDRRPNARPYAIGGTLPISEVPQAETREFVGSSVRGPLFVRLAGQHVYLMPSGAMCTDGVTTLDGECVNGWVKVRPGHFLFWFGQGGSGETILTAEPGTVYLPTGSRIIGPSKECAATRFNSINWEYHLPASHQGC